MENNSIRSNQTGVAGPSDPNNYSAIYSQNSQGGGAIPTKQYYAAKPYEFKHRETLNQTVIVAGSYYNTTAGHPKSKSYYHNSLYRNFQRQTLYEAFIWKECDGNDRYTVVFKRGIIDSWKESSA